MFARLRRRLREGNERVALAKDEATVEKALREHDTSEREKADPVDLPPGRTNTDWTYVNWNP
jgi:hypothetical protein